MSKNKPRQFNQPASVTVPEVLVTEPDGPETALPIEARALVDVTVDGKLFRSGDLVTADADVIASLGDQVDTHPEAVAFCKELKNG